MSEACEPNDEGLKIYFNPFAFTVEENNEMIRKGWEPMPMRIPDTTTTRRLDNR